MPKAIESFEATYARALSQLSGSFHILDAFNRAREEDSEKKYIYNDRHEVSDMGRFGIVLAVAAMDDYFTRKYAEIMIPAIKKNGINSRFTEMLESAGLDVSGALELLSMERPYRRIRTLAQDYYRNYTTQSTDKIDALFHTIGISGLSGHAQRRSNKPKALLKSVNELVSRRHKIVHAGDLTRTGKIQKIDQRVVNRIKDIDIFVQSSELHINQFMEQKKKKR